MKKIILATLNSLLMISVMGCSIQSASEKTTVTDSNPEQKAVESQIPEQISQVNLQTYDETASGIPVKTKYPDSMEVSGMGSGEGVGIFFNFKPQGNALDRAELHFFLPTGATTATEVESYVQGSNGLMASNGWTPVKDARPPQELMYPWVKKIITFSSDKEMMGHILLGETNDQGLRVTLLYPAEMADAYWLPAKIVLDSVEFEANLLPLKSSEERLGGDIKSERSLYEEFPLPLDANLVGTDPQQIALNVFGISEPVEGNFQEEVLLEEQSGKKAIVILTQTGLPDDSVEGTRYRLEFMSENEQWRLNWAGRQVRCYRDRNSPVWTTEKCL